MPPILCVYIYGHVAPFCKTYLIFQAALSPYLRTVLKSDPVACQHETSCLVLPDVDSAILSNFLARACLGGNEVAVTNPSLAFLKFRQRPARSAKVKKEEEPEDEEFNEQVSPVKY